MSAKAIDTYISDVFLIMTILSHNILIQGISISFMVSMEHFSVASRWVGTFLVQTVGIQSRPLAFLLKLVLV